MYDPIDHRRITRSGRSMVIGYVQTDNPRPQQAEWYEAIDLAELSNNRSA